MRIVSATVSDVDEVLHVWRAAADPSVTDDVAAVRTLVEHDPHALLLAVERGAVVGTLVAAWDGWRGSFYRLAVLPAFRRQGVATSLVAEGERRLRLRGARRVAAIVVECERPATAFWQAAGYRCQPDLTRYVKTLGASP